MKVLITGGTGLIGKALSAQLLHEGHEVTVLTRAPERVKDALQGVRLHKWDGITAQGWGHLLEETDAIVNLAGENLSAGRWTEARKQSIRDSRVNSGRAVVEAIRAAQNKPAVLIQASGVGYYGVKSSDLLDESAANGSDFLSSISRDWEAASEPVEALGVRRAIIRSGVVLSPQGGALARMLLPFKMFVGGPLGSGQQWLSWIHLEDEVRAIRFLIDHPSAAGAFNLAAEPVTNARFAKIVGGIMHRPSFIPVPAFALRMVLGKMSTVVLDGQRAASRKLTDLGFHFKFWSLENAIKDLVLR